MTMIRVKRGLHHPKRFLRFSDLSFLIPKVGHVHSDGATIVAHHRVQQPGGDSIADSMQKGSQP
jgi:hypothetical protein